MSRPEIRAAVPEGRQLHLEPGEAREQVPAEGRPPPPARQVAVGGGDDAQVHPDRLGRADRLHLVLLEHPQQLHLKHRGQLPDLVEQRAFRRSRTGGARAGPRPRPVYAPRRTPNSSLSASCSGRAPQFTATNGPVRPDQAWSARAASSLPVPVSPCSITGTRVGATRASADQPASSSGWKLWQPEVGGAGRERRRRIVGGVLVEDQEGLPALDGIPGVEHRAALGGVLHAHPVLAPRILR